MVRRALLPILLAIGLALVAAGAPLDAGARSEDRQVAWLRNEAIALRSIEPGDTDFSDLEPLRSVLANKRVVVLGEASHGDGATFLAKSRLVQFLHREMGFDVLAFESGFYDCWKAWQRIEAGDDPAAAFRQAVFPVWAQSRQVQSLIAYFAAAARSQRPLELAGIDPQFTGEMSRRFLLGDLVQLAKAQGLPGDELAARVSEPLANLVEGRYEFGELPSAAARAELLKALDEMSRRLREAGGDIPERGFWLRFADSTRQLGTSSWSIDWKRPLMEDPEGYAARDRVMGENLAWLARHRFAGRKIVVWAGSFHAAREVDEIDVPSAVHARLFRSFQPMGAVARGELGEELYTVAVLAYQGRYAALSGRPIELLRPSAGSLEDLFHRTGLPHAFLDLSRTGRLPGWLRKPLIARPMGYMEMKAPWGRVFDAVLFLDRMAVSERP
ncbi:MAG TPA: erythromycin esterase family protein [Thermoanaerobaculia bacterium]